MGPPYWSNKYNGRVVKITAGRNGQDVRHREVTAPCARCGNDFTFTMTTKPVMHCDSCAVIAKQEKRRRDTERVQARRLDGTYVYPEPKAKRIRKIPYAGHPRSRP